MKKYLILVGILLVLANSFLQAQDTKCPEVEALTKEIELENYSLAEHYSRKVVPTFLSMIESLSPIWRMLV
jgi:hypothetical protein